MPDTSDIASKFSRAIQAVLVDQGCVASEVFIDESSAMRTLPNTTVIPGDGVQSGDYGPGNWNFPNVVVRLRDDAALQPGEADDQVRRTEANARFTLVFNALNRSDDEHSLDYTARELTRLGRLLAVDAGTGAAETQRAADNADMANFTCFLWECDLVGPPKRMNHAGEPAHVAHVASYWNRVVGFSALVCNANL